MTEPITTKSPPWRRIAHIEARPGRAAELRAALIELEAATLSEPGCRHFRLFQALSQPEAFVLFEAFADAAALAEHMASPQARAFFARDLAARTVATETGWPE